MKKGLKKIHLNRETLHSLDRGLEAAVGGVITRFNCTNNPTNCAPASNCASCDTCFTQCGTCPPCAP
jgi:hypothetical protein